MNDRQWSCLGRMKYIWNLDFCFTWFINALTRCLAQIFGLMAKPWRWVGLHPWTPPAMTDRSNRRIHWLPDEHLLGEPLQIGMILFPSQWILTPFGILMHNLNPHCNELKIIKMLHNLHQILFTLIVSQAQRHEVGLNGCDHPFSVGDMKRCDQVWSWCLPIGDKLPAGNWSPVSPPCLH